MDEKRTPSPEAVAKVIKTIEKFDTETLQYLIMKLEQIENERKK